MKISFFVIFMLIGLILLILSLIFKSKDKKMVEQCSLTTKGKVIKYTLWNNNGVHFPIGTELDVFYSPQNPNKSYVMRFVKNPAEKVLFCVGLLFIVLAFIGLVFLPK